MILIGQYDSSYVRRVGIALTVYAMPFEHRPWSVFRDAEKIRPLNPLMRVPALVLEDGEVLVDTASILDHVDMLVPEELRMHPVDEPERRRSRRIEALANGVADKAVSLFYELRLHETPSTYYVERCRSQILGAVAALEAERAKRPGSYWFGGVLGHADIAVATVLRHTREAHPGLIDFDAFPALAAHCARLEANPIFEDVSQPFIAPA